MAQQGFQSGLLDTGPGASSSSTGGVRDNSTSGSRGVTKSWWEICCTWTGLGCCIPEDKWEKRPIAEVTQNKDRNCTDVPCLLLLLGVFISQIILISYASSNDANPEYLVHGTDYTGAICDSNNENGKFTAWAALETTYDIRVCVSDCDYTSNSDLNYLTQIVDNYPSSSFLHAWCIPDESYLDNNASSYGFNSNSESFNRALGDLNTSKWLLLISTLIAIVVSFIYIKFIGCLGRLLVIVSILGVLIGGFLAGLWLLMDGANNIDDPETKYTGQAEVALGVIVFVLLICFSLALFWMRHRLELAFNMLSEASRAVRDMPSTVAFPVLYSFVGIGYLAFWVTIALYIYSCKQKESEDTPENLIEYFGSTYTVVTFNTDLRNALAYHFICLIYMMQVIIYFGFMVLAGTFADWYFSIWDSTQTRKVRGHGTAELSHAPLLESLVRVLRFHMGSLAFGALIITPVRLIRWTLIYVQKKTQHAQNPLTKCLLGCADCCLKCLECIIDKINKEGFIFTTIYGTNFCYSSMIALKLVWTNAIRAALVEGISHYMELFGRLTIAALTTGICLAVLSSSPSYSSNLSSVLLPGVIVFIGSYMIGSLFMLVYEVAVDTIFLCYLVDEESHPDGPKFAHEELTKMTSLRKQNSV